MEIFISEKLIMVLDMVEEHTSWLMKELYIGYWDSGAQKGKGVYNYEGGEVYDGVFVRG